MFNKKFFLAALLVAGTVGGLASCDKGGEDDFAQNSQQYEQPDHPMYIIGSHWASWTPANVGTEQKFTRSEENSGIFELDVTVTQEMVDAWCGFKFIAQQDWSPAQYGIEDVDIEECNDAFVALLGEGFDRMTLTGPTTNRGNIVATQPGTFHIEYRPYNFESIDVGGEAGTLSNKFVIDFTPAA